MKEISIYNLMETLPHGSGINGKWTYKKDKKGNYHFYNTYDYMNDNGFYDCYIGFEVIMYQTNIKLIFHPVSYHQKYLLYQKDIEFRDYLNTLFYEWFSENTPIYKIIEK